MYIFADGDIKPFYANMTHLLVDAGGIRSTFLGYDFNSDDQSHDIFIYSDMVQGRIGYTHWLAEINEVDETNFRTEQGFISEVSTGVSWFDLRIGVGAWDVHTWSVHRSGRIKSTIYPVTIFTFPPIILLLQC